MDVRLVRLRVELFTAAQQLTGDDSAEFWKLIGELSIAFESEFRRGQAAAEAGQ